MQEARPALREPQPILRAPLSALRVDPAAARVERIAVRDFRPQGGGQARLIDVSKEVDRRKMIELLNQALVHEQSGQIRYLAHAAVVTGLHAEPIIARLKELAGDEAGHADRLRDRIVALGGTPVVAVEPSEVPLDTLRILQINLQDERDAVALYQRLFAMIPQKEILLYETIEHILKDEQEHVEELTRLLGR